MKMISGQRCDGGLRPKEAFVDAGGMTWRYLEWGNHGPAFVLWHGITSSARNWWRVAPFLAGLGFHVWAPDLPGHGSSDASPNGYAVDQTARLLDAWLAALHLEAPIILGHSWGGLNALVHATLPDAQICARALVLEDPALRIGDDPSSRIRSFSAGLGTPHNDESVAALADEHPRWHPCDVWWKAEARQQAQQAAVEGFFHHNAGIDVLARLCEVAVPVHLLLGDPAEGGIWTPERISAARALEAPHVMLDIIQHSSHNIHRDSFVPFCMTLGTWLRRLTP